MYPRVKGRNPRHEVAGVKIRMLVLTALLLATAGCVSRGPRGGGGAEEILGEDVSEGKVIEGKIAPQPVGSGGPSMGRLGFRVQLIASSSKEEAERAADVIREKLSERVHIEYFEPYYKVRVGDFLTREGAEDVRVQVVGMGFRDAWIVETPIVEE